jgi:hypothetical protein
MRRGLGAAAAVAVAALAFAALADAVSDPYRNSIATAPDLPLDQTTAGGWTDAAGEFWRITLSAGDRLAVDYSVPSQSGCRPLNIYVYTPNITDAEVETANPAARGSTPNDGEFTFIAPFAGRWTVLFGQSCFGASMSYSFTAHVRRFTATTLSVPRHVAAGRKLRIRGSVKNVLDGKIVLRLSGTRSVHKTWPLTNGRFAGAVRLNRGTYRLRASYLGDASHRGSFAKAVVKVGR